jgi:hypothetical protein
MPKIRAEQAQPAQSAIRHTVVTLKPSDNIATFAAENVDAWALVQARGELRVKKGDRVTLVSNDGLTMHDSCVVTKAESGRVWLSKPLRVVTLEADGLYGNDRYQIIPIGTSFGIFDKRLDRQHGDKTYPSAAAAESALHRLSPVRVG